GCFGDPTVCTSAERGKALPAILERMIPLKGGWKMFNMLWKVTVVIALAVSFSGCTIRHVVSEDYHQYLVNNEGSFQLPKTDYEAEYVITPETLTHNYEFRAATTGYANLWIVKFGEILEETLQSNDVRSAFKQLTKSENGAGPGMLIKFDLSSYEFEGFQASVALQVTVLKKGAVVFEESYFEKGTSQGGKMFWAGVFGMKNAIQQSTKNAIDRILERALRDMLAKRIG
ncbi:MAG: hypothetical protein P8X63_13245, partial [Desulfuromonadaceae bacterium]